MHQNACQNNTGGYILVLRPKASLRDEIVFSVMNVADKMSTCREYC